MAHAADLPKQGTDTYTTAYVLTSSNTIKLGDRTVVNYDASGINRNDSGGQMFNNTSTRCLGMVDIVGTEAINRGSCADMDQDGDQIFTTYEAHGITGTHTYIGGTGKYTGITGGADYTVQRVKTSDGRSLSLVTRKAVWKLPPN